MDIEGIDSAVIVGSSYGTCLAQGLGVRHPERVAGMVPASTVLTAQDHVVVREHARRPVPGLRRRAHHPAGTSGRTNLRRDASQPLLATLVP